MEGYKQTEVGLIPDDWSVRLMGDVLKVRHGKNQHAVKNAEGIYPILGSGGIIGFSNSFLYDKPSVLIGRKGTIDEPQYMDSPFWTIDTLFFTEINERYNPKYLYFLFQTIDWYSFNEASGVPSLNGRTIENISITLPSTLREQTAIATTLSDADALITNLEKLIEKKKAIKQGAMQQLLKPKKGWEVKRLGKIGECIIGLTYRPTDVKESGLLVLRSSNIQNNSLRYDDNVFVDLEVPEKLIVKETDILICVRNGSRDLIGKCALIQGKAIGETFGAFMAVFRSPFNEFIYNLFQSNIIKSQIDEYLGATINQITNKSLNSFIIPFPSTGEQEAIVTILKDMAKEISDLEMKLSKYKLLKDGMMHKLLTGKIRLV